MLKSKLNLRTVICIVFLLFFINKNALHAQRVKLFNNDIGAFLDPGSGSHGLFKCSFIYGYKKGGALALSYGLWDENPVLQYSINTSLQWRFGRKFLGNYRNDSYPKDKRTKSQLVFCFSPMLTANFSGDNSYVYQELEPFYWGTANAVFCKYKYSFTLGTTFTMSPRGTYRNVSTLRNRTQQVAMVSLNVRNFNLTIYDDYLSIFTTALQLGDNWDRFFTGGGFARMRFSDRLTMHLYSEVYTGINRANPFLKPDVISYTKQHGEWRQKNYANQDPTQEYFNSSWLVLAGTYTGSYSPEPGRVAYMPSLTFFAGNSSPWTMFSQTFIHSLIPYDSTNHFNLHYFINRSNVPGNLEAGGKTRLRNFIRNSFLGVGFQSNIRTR